MIRAPLIILISAAFLLNSLGSWPVQGEEFILPKPGVMVHLSQEFVPAHLQGIIIHPENALKFDFIIYKGDQILSDQEKKTEYTKLIKYFLASLAVPDDDQWVNLSPYEKNRIIKEDFGKTEMGRDLLAQDYMLKQITASLIYPQDKLGQEFWNRIYTKAYQQFGTTNIPVNTFNKVWIVPDNAEVFEKGNMAYVVKHHLKVMLEEDYLSLNKNNGIQTTNTGGQNKAHTIGSQIVREVVLPALEKEVNEGKNFASLRQVFSGVVLAAWYKRALKESFLGRIYMNRSRLKGVEQDPKNNQIIYQQYLKAFKKGVFSLIKEDIDKYTNEPISRKYFSGGVKTKEENLRIGPPTGDQIAVAAVALRRSDRVATTFQPQTDRYGEINGPNAAMTAEFVVLPQRIFHELSRLSPIRGVNKFYFPHESRTSIKFEEDNQGEGVVLNLLIFYGHDNRNFSSYRFLRRGRYSVESLNQMVSLLNESKKLDAVMINNPVSSTEPDEVVQKANKEILAVVNKIIPVGQVKEPTKEEIEEDIQLAQSIVTNLDKKLTVDIDGMINDDSLSAGVRFMTAEEVESAARRAVGNKLKEEMRNKGLPASLFRWITITNVTALSNGGLATIDESKLVSATRRGSEIVNDLIAAGILERHPEMKNKLRYKDGFPHKDSVQRITGKKDYLSIVRYFPVQGGDRRERYRVTANLEVQNNAMMAQETSPATITRRGQVIGPTGGIDVNATYLNLHIKRDGNGVPLPLTRQDRAQISELAGLKPIILKIQPAIESPYLTQILINGNAKEPFSLTK